MEQQNLVDSTAQVLENDVFTFEKGEQLTAQELRWFIARNQQITSDKYDKYMNYYLGKHDILNKTLNLASGTNSQIVDNLPRHLVDIYNGFFTGIEPKITLEKDKENKDLQEWNNENSIFDKLSELSKQVDIFGRSYFYVYQNEKGETCITVASPRESFMIYDNTVSQRPLAFVMYHKDLKGQTVATIYYDNVTQDLDGNDKLTDHVNNADNVGGNSYGIVPAVEFYEEEERQGLYGGKILTLVDALNKTLSQKEDNLEYVADSYMVLKGAVNIKDEDIAKMRRERLIVMKGTDGDKMSASFLEKPDGDNIQENMIKHLTDAIFQNTGIPNMKDEAFGGNVSGVAIQYKLMPMQNKAMTKQRKFTQALRRTYKIIFSDITKVLTDEDAWKELEFKFHRNIPANLADEADTANKLKGLVSDETMLSGLSVVPDPKAELKRMQDEKDKNYNDSMNKSDPEYLKKLGFNSTDEQEKQLEAETSDKSEQVENDNA